MQPPPLQVRWARACGDGGRRSNAFDGERSNRRSWGRCHSARAPVAGRWTVAQPSGRRGGAIHLSRTADVSARCDEQPENGRRSSEYRRKGAQHRPAAPPHRRSQVCTVPALRKKVMDYYITKKIAEDERGQAQLEEIAGPFRTVTQLIEALDTLLTHYSRKFPAKR